jgi:glucokinase
MGIFERDNRSHLRELVTSPDEITTETILLAYEWGDAAVRELVHDIGRHLGSAIAYLVSILNVNRIVITGGIASFGEKIIEPIYSKLGERALTALSQDTQIETTELGNDIVILGGAVLVLQKELGLV